MPRSRLEKYLSVLEVLVLQPLVLEDLSYEANIECGTLRRYLNFLISNNLVEERALDKGRTAYAITERGLVVFKTLQARKYFEKLKRILPVVEEATEIEPFLERHSRQLKKGSTYSAQPKAKKDSR